MNSMQKTAENTENVLIREYQEGDEAAILSLLKLVLRQSLNRDEELMSWVNPQYWNWMFKNNPAGNPIIVLAEVAKKLVGHYALVPMRMLIKGKERTGTLAMNMVIHPDYQGRGIFSALVDKAAYKARTQDMPVTFVFPNVNSRPVLVEKLGWLVPCSMTTLFRPLKAVKILRRQIRNRNLKNILLGVGLLVVSRVFCRSKKVVSGKVSIEQCSSFYKRFNDFAETASQAYGIITIRDGKYLTWRYMDNPIDTYTIYTAEEGDKVLGYIVLKLLEDETSPTGIIMDMLILPDRKEIASLLIQKAIGYFREQEADVVLCYIPKSNPYYGILRNNGFIVHFLTEDSNICRLVARSNTAEIPPSFIENDENWFITCGDRNDM